MVDQAGVTFQNWDMRESEKVQLALYGQGYIMQEAKMNYYS
jgi:hypothetical protein